MVLLAAAVVILTVILIFKASELTVLYPVIFGLSGLLSGIYSMEGVLYNRNRVIKRRRIWVFGIISLVLLAVMGVSIWIITR